MSDRLSAQDLAHIHAGIRDKYTRVASGPTGHFTYPTGKDGLAGLNYDGELLSKLPDAVAASYCGVGNPLSLGAIKPGDSLLDVGCGAGVDALLAAILVGDSGSVLGIDLTPEMIRKAVENQRAMQVGNVEFMEAGIQDLPSMADHFDGVISNGVFNLIPEKEAALKAVFRLLKPGGCLSLADQFLKGPTSKNLGERVASWFQ